MSNILNGHVLSPRQELTLNFALFLIRQELKNTDTLGEDATGRAMREGYLLGAKEISALLNEFKV